MEAGPGTGKTFAYLIPAIYSGQRVVVSTGTKNLQEQLFFKDIPLLKEILPIKFTAAYMKGQGKLSLSSPVPSIQSAAALQDYRRRLLLQRGKRVGRSDQDRRPRRAGRGAG